MKKLLAVLLMIMVLPCTGYAFPVTIIDAGTGTNVTWTGDGAGYGFAGTIKTSIGEVYCVELGQSVGPGDVINYSPVTPTGAYIGAAWLMNEFGAQADTADEAAGLQAAIWEAIYGNGFNLTGTVAVLGFQTNYLNALDALQNGPTLPPGFVLLYNESSQDLLISRVPEPMTMFLLGIGLVGLAGLRRKE
jgi:hypothetical protein